jgi:hypothetical protein
VPKARLCIVRWKTNRAISEAIIDTWKWRAENDREDLFEGLHNKLAIKTNRVTLVNSRYDLLKFLLS